MFLILDQIFDLIQDFSCTFVINWEKNCYKLRKNNCYKLREKNCYKLKEKNYQVLKKVQIISHTPVRCDPKLTNQLENIRSSLPLSSALKFSHHQRLIGPSKNYHLSSVITPSYPEKLSPFPPCFVFVDNRPVAWTTPPLDGAWKLFDVNCSFFLCMLRICHHFTLLCT